MLNEAKRHSTAPHTYAFEDDPGALMDSKRVAEDKAWRTKATMSQSIPSHDK